MSAPLVLVANARLPSERAQSLQVAQASASYARAGAPTTLLYARRRGTPVPPDPEALWRRYAVPPGPRPELRAIPCVDWIETVPRGLQYAPARVQELSFAHAAARVVRRRHAGARVLSREAETVRWLGDRPGLFLELHRVPEGRLRRRWLLQAAERARGVLAISGGVRDDLLELGVEEAKLLVEHDAYDPGRFAIQIPRAEARRALALDPNEPVVVYTGGLLEWKGVDVLVDAARHLPKVRFVIAGGMREDVERLRARAKGLENVRIDGFQQAPRVPLYLAAADVGVVPNRARPAISARYTSPLKVFEALAVGLPLVVSDLPSLREILRHDEAEFVTPDEPEALAAGVSRLLAEDGRRALMGRRMRDRAGEHTWDARAARVLAWMEERG